MHAGVCSNSKLCVNFSFSLMRSLLGAAGKFYYFLQDMLAASMALYGLVVNIHLSAMLVRLRRGWVWVAPCCCWRHPTQIRCQAATCVITGLAFTGEPDQL